MSVEETKSFLNGGEREERLYDRETIWPRKRNSTIAILATTNIVLLITCIFLVVSPHWRPSEKSIWHQSANIPEPYSPANSIVEYEQRKMVVNNSDFSGPPSPKWEQAMHDLMEGTLLRVSEDELQAHGFDSIALKDGGYAAGLGVAHNLHCVKRIKMYIYRDYFYPDLDPDSEEMADVQDHADHCLDWIRQSMMCHVDYAMYTVMWAEEEGLHKGHIRHNEPGLQKCVNWDKLHDWMKSRSANTNMLERPD